MAAVPPQGDAFDFFDGASDMAAAMRRIDWDRSALGPVAGWPQSLRSALGICLDSSFQIAIYWGPQLALLYNDAWSPILGSKHPWALGRPGAEVWPEIWDTVGPLFDSVMRSGRATRSLDQLLAMHRHGFTEECYFDYTFSPIRGEGGRVEGIFNVVVETTFRLIGERRTRLLRDLGERTAAASGADDACRLAAEVLSTAAARHDLPFALLYLAVDDGSGRFRLAASAGTLPDAAMPQLLQAHDASAAWPLQAFQDGGTGSVRVDALGARFGTPLSGGPWPEPCEQARLMPLPALDGQRPAGVLVAGISPRLRLDSEYEAFLDRVAGAVASAVGRARTMEQERQRIEALAAIDRAKTLFFSNVSHELRTPLTLILGPLDDLLSASGRTLDAATRDTLGVAHRNALRLLKLVNTLLDFSRIEAGRMQARFEPTPLDAFTRDLASTFRSAMTRAGLAFEVACADLGQPVYVDREMWEKVVLNLLSNALKYTDRGCVNLRLRRDGERVLLQVSDTGCGVGADDVPRLFERFYRVPHARGRTHEGTGIGLALVHELVRLHGGEISVVSQPEVGSTFTVSLPLGSAHLPHEQVQYQAAAHVGPGAGMLLVDEAAQWVTGGAGTDEDGDAPARPAPDPAAAPSLGSVVLADDNADMRAYVQQLLSGVFDVRVARDGEEALALVRAAPPDLVLSDVMMPRLDGLGLLKALRADPALQAVPVILLSARAGEQDRVEGLEAMADDYLAKPFSARELLARVTAHVGVARLRHRAQAALQDANRQLADANRLLAEADHRKDVFLATLAHELRNPLAPIRQAAEVARAPNVTPAQLKWTQQVIERQVGHMALLLDDLLDVSRITRGQLTLRKQRVALTDVMEAALETARPLLESHGHRLLLGMPPVPVTLTADPLRLAQVLANLLTNASKYTDPGGTVRVTARIEGYELVISVSDNGIGIPPDKLADVFEMFSQLQGAMERSQGGLGIGLALVKGLVVLHGGTVRASSRGRGHGSEFIVTLPLEGPADASGTPGEVSPGAPVDEAPRRRILVVDDNADAAETLALSFTLDGHDAVFAIEPVQALALMASFRPQVVLLDIGLPGMSGYELARRIRALPEGRDVTLIAVTGWGKDDDKRQAQEAGFDLHFTKPVDLQRLREVIVPG